MRIPILPTKHSNEIESIEVDTLARKVIIKYKDGQQEFREYTATEFNACVLVFSIGTANRCAEIRETNFPVDKIQFADN